MADLGSLLDQLRLVTSPAKAQGVRSGGYLPCEWLATLSREESGGKSSTAALSRAEPGGRVVRGEPLRAMCNVELDEFDKGQVPELDLQNSNTSASEVACPLWR